MKQRRRWLSVVFGTAAGFSAIAFALWANALTDSPPKITVQYTVQNSSLRLDEGTAFAGAVLYPGGGAIQVPFVLTNTGSAPLTFSLVSTTPIGVTCTLVSNQYTYTLAAGTQGVWTFYCDASEAAALGPGSLVIQAVPQATNPKPATPTPAASATP